MPVTSAYAALFALLFIGLSVRTIRVRRRARVAVGAGDDLALLRAIRVHANFAEYVPFALLLIAFAEFRGTSSWLVHGACIVLAIGRIAHAVGVSRVDEDYRFRVAGMACTLSVIAVVAVALLVAVARG